MGKLNCRAGDLVIIVDAFTSDNIGMFVKVLGKHRNQSACLSSSSAMAYANIFLINF